MEKSKVRNSGRFYFKFLILNSRKGGFTLFELIVVMFILSLIVGLVMPSFYATGERLKSEAEKMASLLRHLNDSAISRKETFSLKINLDTHVVSWETPEGGRVEKFENLSALSSDSTGDISNGEITFFFGPSGFQENLTVTLKNDRCEMSVSFNPLSGRAKVIQNSK